MTKPASVQRYDMRESNKDGKVPPIGTGIRGRPRKTGGPLQDLTEYNYSDEELVWLKAIDEYKTKYKVRYPRLVEYLIIAKELGYRKEMP